LRGFWRRILVKHVLQSFSPVALLLFSGLALFGCGTAFGLGTLVYRLTGGGSPSAGTVLLSVTPLLAGVHLVINSWILDIQEAPDRPARRQTPLAGTRGPESTLRDARRAAGSSLLAQTRGEV
jgi:hypothetical protein